MTIEKRAVLELRANGRKLEGYAAKFGTVANLGTFTEVIRAGAFREGLASGRDILALMDHDRSKVLARTKSGTLKLAEDSTGLQFELSLPDTQPGRDVLALAERGDLGGMSFAFTLSGASHESEQWSGRQRTLTAVNLHEISVVSAWPAYPETVVNPRSLTPRLNLAQRYLETIWD